MDARNKKLEQQRQLMEQKMKQKRQMSGMIQASDIRANSAKSRTNSAHRRDVKAHKKEWDLLLNAIGNLANEENPEDTYDGDVSEERVVKSVEARISMKGRAQRIYLTVNKIRKCRTIFNKRRCQVKKSKLSQSLCINYTPKIRSIVNLKKRFLLDEMSQISMKSTNPNNTLKDKKVLLNRETSDTGKIEKLNVGNNQNQIEGETNKAEGGIMKNAIAKNIETSKSFNSSKESTIEEDLQILVDHFKPKIIDHIVLKRLSNKFKKRRSNENKAENYVSETLDKENNVSQVHQRNSHKEIQSTKEVNLVNSNGCEGNNKDARVLIENSQNINRNIETITGNGDDRVFVDNVTSKQNNVKQANIENTNEKEEIHPSNNKSNKQANLETTNGKGKIHKNNIKSNKQAIIDVPPNPSMLYLTKCECEKNYLIKAMMHHCNEIYKIKEEYLRIFDGTKEIIEKIEMNRCFSMLMDFLMAEDEGDEEKKNKAKTILMNYADTEFSGDGVELGKFVQYYVFLYNMSRTICMNSSF